MTGINPTIIQSYSNGILDVINTIIVPVLIAVAFLVFLWGVYKYFIYGAENESEKAEGREFAMWGIIGFVIMLSLWGIINMVMSTLSLSAGNAPPYPVLKSGTSECTPAMIDDCSAINETCDPDTGSCVP